MIANSSPRSKSCANTDLSGARVFDLGAHQGVVALALAHLVERSGCVIAVEAIPFDAAAAQRNQEVNEFEQLKVINAAIAAISGTVDFVYSGRASWEIPPSLQSK